MHAIAQAAALVCFVLLALLPIIAFRRGRPTRGWIVTATPFAADGLLLCCALAGGVSAATGARVTALLAGLALPVLAGAAALIVWTVRTHRVRPALWHQPHDEPSVLVLDGPYARVRHPFYAAFSLLLLGTALALPHPLSAGILAVGVAQLRSTAKGEEHRLVHSRFGRTYARYMQRTGRFAPRFRAPPSNVRAS